MNQELLQIVHLAREGHQEAALAQLRTYLRVALDDAHAWVVLGGLTADPEVRREALRRAVRLAPEDELAQQAWQKFQHTALTQRSGPPPPAASMAEFHAAREARDTPWPFYGTKDPRCTLGQWLDEGLVTRQDLKWAESEGESEAIREAARDILRTTHRLPDMPMTLEAARLTAWSYRRTNRPLGELVQSGQIGPRELREAAWHAPDARQREAARQLLYQALHGESRQHSPDCPANSISSHISVATRYRAGRPLQVMQCSDYLRREITRYRRRLTPLWLSALFVFLVSLYVLLFQPALIILGGGLVGLSLMVTIFTRMIQRKIHSFQLGKLGEDRVAALLQKHLSGEWVLFRNLQLPGHREDIAMILVGPVGMYVLEVITYRGVYRYTGMRFHRRWAGGHYIRSHSPARDIRRRAAQLSDYLKRHGVEVDVEPRLVWAGSGVLHLQKSEVYVWFPHQLPEELAQLTAQSPQHIPAVQVEQLVKILRRVCIAL